MTMRGLGHVFHPTYTDKKTGHLRQSATWWIQYYVRGKRKRENSRSRNKSQAVKLLNRRLGEIGQGRLVGPDIERTTFEDLVEMLTDDYKANQRRSLNRVIGSVGHLQEFFGLERALDITSDRISSYVKCRLEVGAANATVNRELAALKRMFRLGVQSRKVAEVPYVPMLQERNIRTGFFDRPQFETVLKYLSEDLKPVVHTAYITGWRGRSEILTRRWQHLDLRAGWLRLEPGETKNGKGRMFPLLPELRCVLEKQRERTRALEKTTGQIVPWIFHRDGRPIKTFYRSWKTACKQAGVSGRIMHDFRRTAVRNLERAGVPRSDAMAMVGHVTESIYRRYAISDETSLRESGAKLAALHQAEREDVEDRTAQAQSRLAGAEITEEPTKERK